MVAALPAGAEPGQLRLAGRRPASRHALHRVPAGAARHGDGARHRPGHGRLLAQLRRPPAGAVGPAGALPQPARQRVRRHRGRHGDQHPAAQPARGRVRRAVAPRPPRGIARGAARGAARAHQGPGLPDQGPDRRHQRHPRRLHDRPWVGHDARGRRGRGGQPRPDGPGHHRAALPGQPGRAGPQDRRARRQRQGAGHRRPARRLVVAHRHAAGRRAQARRGRQRRAQQPLQAHPAAGHVRLQHARARRRRAAHPRARRVHPALDDPPDRGHRPAHPLPAAPSRGARATSCAACSRRWSASTR